MGAVLILLWGEQKARSSHGRATHSRKGKAEGAFPQSLLCHCGPAWAGTGRMHAAVGTVRPYVQLPAVPRRWIPDGHPPPPALAANCPSNQNQIFSKVAAIL